MDAPERFEQLIAFVSSHLPAPVELQPGGDGSIIFSGGTPGEVIVHLTESSIVVAEYAGEWESPDSFVVQPRRVGVLKWRRLPETELMNALAQLIKGAQEMRLARYVSCRVCGETNPPEWMHDADVCLTCAERQSDVVAH